MATRVDCEIYIIKIQFNYLHLDSFIMYDFIEYVFVEMRFIANNDILRRPVMRHKGKHHLVFSIQC